MEEEVLDRALDVFWSKGYEGASIHDLTAATGLGRASLYGAFGDKQKLYQRVVEHYATKAEARVACAPVASAHGLCVHDRLLGLFAAWMGPRCAVIAERGCFLASAGVDGGEPGVARELLAASMKRRERILAKMLREAQAAGELDDGRDPTGLARMLVLVMQGIAAAASVGWSREQLDQALREAVRVVAPPLPK
jgi:AcrR family transcriptional regulator